jgi:hypothetical protein
MRSTLAALDPDNAGWARDVVVAYWRLAEADPVNATANWAEVVTRLEEMESRGTLAPVDRQYLDTARAKLAAANAAR